MVGLALILKLRKQSHNGASRRVLLFLLVPLVPSNNVVSSSPPCRGSFSSSIPRGIMIHLLLYMWSPWLGRLLFFLTVTHNNAVSLSQTHYSTSSSYIPEYMYVLQFYWFMPLDLSFFCLLFFFFVSIILSLKCRFLKTQSDVWKKGKSQGGVDHHLTITLFHPH